MRTMDERPVIALVPAGFNQILDAFVSRQGVSRSDVIREALVDHLEACGEPVPSRVKRRLLRHPEALA